MNLRSGVGIGRLLLRCTTYEPEYDEVSETARTVVDDEDRWTDLLDEHGEPIMRPKVRLGFIR
jgi:hypothetical protein